MSHVLKRNDQRGKWKKINEKNKWKKIKNNLESKNLFFFVWKSDKRSKGTIHTCGALSCEQATKGCLHVNTIIYC
jgi:hypothetical protein